MNSHLLSLNINTRLYLTHRPIGPPLGGSDHSHSRSRWDLNPPSHHWTINISLITTPTRPLCFHPASASSGCNFSWPVYVFYQSSWTASGAETADTLLLHVRNDRCATLGIRIKIGNSLTKLIKYTNRLSTQLTWKRLSPSGHFWADTVTLICGKLSRFLHVTPVLKLNEVIKRSTSPLYVS